MAIGHIQTFYMYQADVKNRYFIHYEALPLYESNNKEQHISL